MFSQAFTLRIFAEKVPSLTSIRHGLSFRPGTAFDLNIGREPTLSGKNPRNVLDIAIGSGNKCALSPLCEECPRHFQDYSCSGGMICILKKTEKYLDKNLHAVENHFAPVSAFPSK